MAAFIVHVGWLILFVTWSGIVLMFCLFIVISYVRSEWREVDEEMEKEKMFQERLKTVDDILDKAFKK